MLVIDLWFQLTRIRASSQNLVFRMSEKPVGEGEDGLLDRFAQAISNPGTGIERVLVVSLDDAFRRDLLRCRQARRMHEAKQHGEVRKEPVGKDAVEIEFQIGQLDEP